jgi:hypothetical protein
MMVPIEAESLKLGTLGFIADAGNHRQPQARNKRHSVWSRSGIEYNSRFKSVAVDPCQACRPAVGYKHLTLVSNYARRFWKILQCTDVPKGVMVDHLNAVAARVRNEHTARFRIERSMVEK